MMYSEKMVLAVKVGGRVLRDVSGEVYLPFGSEYSLILKNMSGKRACVNVEIDDRKVTGDGLILDAGGKVDLERFVGGDMDGGRRFRFIEKTEKVSAHRGDRIEDGFVRVTWQYEQPQPVVTTTTHYHYDHWYPYWHSRPYLYWESIPYYYGGILRNTSIGSAGNSGIACSASVGSATSTSSVNYCSASAGDTVKASNDAGITVEGSRSDQKFTNGHIGVLEPQVHSMVVRLLGRDDGLPVAAPITVKTKKTCGTCGSDWDYAHEYCGSCGTFLRVAG